MIAILVIPVILLIPALCAMGGWATASKLHWPVRHLIAFACGILFAPAFWFGLVIYASEGGGDDTDPLVFMLLMIGTTAVVSMISVFACDTKDQRA